MIELERFCDRSDRGTIFEDLVILDLRSDTDIANCRSLDCPSWRRLVASYEKPKTPKSDGTPDMRFRSSWVSNDKKLWPLITFTERLYLIVLEGDLFDECHSWRDPKFRPAQIDGGGVYLLDWPYRPVYKQGGFLGFAENVKVLLALVAEQMKLVAEK